MPAGSVAQALALPRGCSKIVNSAVLHAFSIAATALTAAWGRAAQGHGAKRKERAETDRLRTEIALLTEETISSWIRRVDEGGERALVQTEEPVNKFPEFVAYLVRSLKLMCPALGKVRIAQMRAWAGLHLGATTVGRMLKRDLTEADAVAVDHASRLVVGFALFRERPAASGVCGFLGRAIKNSGAKPTHVITDKGKQFFCAAFQGWCRRRSIRPRFGAVGKHGSIAIVERFVRSMKFECTTRILVPPRFEPRVRWPRRSPCAKPAAPVEGRCGVHVALVLGHVDDREHLPVVELRRAA